MRRVTVVCVLAAATGAHARSAIAHGASTRVGRAATSALLTLRGGEEPSDALLQATYSCNQLYSSVLADAMSEVAALRKSVAGGEAVPTFGAKADEIVADACDKFEAEAPKGDAEVSAVYSSRAEELRATLVTSLEPVFVQQICLLKDAAMEQFKRGMVGDGDASESLAAAEGAFVREASASVPGKTGWSFKLERASLVGAMQALQAQYMGGQGGKWNLGGAYRPPDTNINLSASYQQGRTNLQVSMVPDEGANLLGPNGFTQGVGPANLGLSFNIHI
jgi:hypothetical protein